MSNFLFQFVLQLEEGVWFANGLGDPPRTLVRKNAKKYRSENSTFQDRNDARKYRPFPNAKAEFIGTPE